MRDFNINVLEVVGARPANHDAVVQNLCGHRVKKKVGQSCEDRLSGGSASDGESFYYKAAGLS